MTLPLWHINAFIGRGSTSHCLQTSEQFCPGKHWAGTFSRPQSAASPTVERSRRLTTQLINRYQ
jgi:hypothetical protein